ncbi:EAL domain-containing protein [Cetobacterium somerae]|uniref:EAL domain-containing protein n=1 Tax=Cetobacterium TaxID=180162 RepID=UPI001F06ED8D|nr:EAL domain-containing protein [Cetobacterium somerae]MCX3067629.1 EAL domain-containing protein [Cetobacterium somerae]UPO97537.1 EAL domain-containing protein [Cetobacterium somerae]
MLKVFILCFLLTQILLAASYIPKNIKEEKILESYRDTQLVLGLKATDFDNTIIDNQSLNTIVEDLFKNYLRLNIRVVKGSWDELLSMYSKKEIDILGSITQSEERKENSVFSLPLYDDSIYLATSNIEKYNLKDLKSLKEQDIFVTKDSIYTGYLKKFLRGNDIKVNIIEVEDSFLEKDGIFLTSKYNVVGWENTIKIGYLPDISIGLQKKLNDLTAIVNNALLEKYQGDIAKYLEKQSNVIYKNKFLKSLTQEERKYLENLSQITIALEPNNTLSYYSKDMKKFIGVIPFFIERFSKRTGINFKIVNDRNNNWNNIYNDFLEKKIRVVPLPENKEWSEDIIFTEPIYNPTLYKVSSFFSHNTKIGVVKGSIEESFVQEYYLKDDILFYKDYDELENSLNNYTINAAFLFDINKMDTSKFKVDEFMKIPISLGLYKSDEILKEIINKGIKNGLSIRRIEEEADIVKKQEAFNEYQRFQLTNKILYLLLAISLMFGMISIYKMLLNHKITKELKKDLITSLPNRVEFLNFIDEKKELKGYAIVVDINNFKEINDKYGQSSGDDILRIVADKLKRIFINQNIYRVSGDEFYIFSEEEFLIERLEELKKEMHSLKLSYQVDLSIGFYKNYNKNLETSFKYAYMAMEEVKKKNNFYYVEATDELIEKKEREYSIKSLLRNKNLSGLYGVYQPKFNIKNKNIVGAEVLARWKDEKLGFISPGEFIPIAEEINLIHLIDYKIANEGIKFISILKKNNLIDENFRMSFNLSMKSLERDDVVSVVKALLKENKVSGDYMEIEITESIFSTNLKTTLEKINELKKMNISLSMDDFTAGHSTVSLLPILPLDVVKFDKGILDAIGTKGDLVASNIYMALIGLIKDLNLKIVSEGIETKLQLEFLEKANVDIGQGYIFSKPIEDLNFIKKLTEKNTGS